MERNEWTERRDFGCRLMAEPGQKFSEGKIERV
jgi:hypothetical protein